MKYNLKSRRMFLTGVGQSLLTIPFLPSLLPREARAQSCASQPPLRFFCGGTLWSTEPRYFLGNLVADNRISPEVAVKSLNGLKDISTIIGSSFNPLLSKINIIRGIDMLPLTSVMHDALNYGLSACPTISEIDSIDLGHRRPAFISGINSIDILLSKSNKIYPNQFPTVRRHINVAAFAQWSDVKIPTAALENSQQVRNLITSTEVYSLFMKDLTNQSGANPPPVLEINDTVKTNELILNKVYQDYNSVMQSKNIGSDDKKRLNDFMGLVNEIHNRFKALLGVGPVESTKNNNCKAVQFNAAAENANYDLRRQNQSDILVAAMACDLTRVVNMNFDTFIDTGTSYKFEDILDFHMAHHNMSTNRAKLDTVPGKKMLDAYLANYVRVGKSFSYLVDRMNSITEENGSLLDNSLVYLFPNFGMCNNTTVKTLHPSVDMGIITAGGLGGRLNTGYFIDYRHQTEKYNNPGGKWPYDVNSYNQPVGFPINRLLTTFLNAFGLQPSEYERPNRAGFGVYEDEKTNGVLNSVKAMTPATKARLLSTEARRASLPFLIKNLKPAC